MTWSWDQIGDLADKYGTPFYAYDENVLRTTYEKLRRGLHPAADVYLSLKTNNNAAIASLYNDWGSGVEVASTGELRLGMAAGFPPERIIYSGPGKTDADLAVAAQAGIRCIMVESIAEMRKLADLARKLDRSIPIAVRVNPDAASSGASLIRMGGVPRQFGIDESELGAFFATLRECEGLGFQGIHVYMGTQVLQEESIVQSFRLTIALAEKISENYGFPCRLIDLGGGFGVPYFAHEKPLNLSALLQETNELIAGVLRRWPDTRFIVESGRYLLAEAGLYAARVLYKKKSKGETFLVVDGGMHHHAGAAFRGRAIRNNFPVRLVSRREDLQGVPEEETVHVVGPLCTPEDCLARSVELPFAEPGDIICWLKSGAYGFAFSPLQFLGHSTPLELLLTERGAVVIRDRGEAEDLLLRQRLPKPDRLREGAGSYA